MKKIIALVSEDFEDLELWYPVLRLKEEGCQVDFVAAEKVLYHGKYGVPCEVNLTFSDINDKDYDGILVPGGWAPDKLRRYPEVIKMVQNMHKDNKVIGQICHAGWVLASAEILEGKTVTSTPGIKDDLRHAGATWVDKTSVVDGNIVSGRRPQDLPQYMKDYISVLNKQ